MKSVPSLYTGRLAGFHRGDLTYGCFTVLEVNLVSPFTGLTISFHRGRYYFRLDRCYGISPQFYTGWLAGFHRGGS
jgi:hypothetical protein